METKNERILTSSSEKTVNDYFTRAKESKAKGLDLKAALEFYQGLQLLKEGTHYKFIGKITEVTFDDNSWDYKDHKTAEESLSLFNLKNQLELFNAIKELPRKEQIPLLRQCRNNYSGKQDCKIGNRLSREKGWRANTWKKSSILNEVLEYLTEIEKDPHEHVNATWLMQVGPGLVKANTINTDIFFYISLFILPSLLQPKESFIKIQNSLLPGPSFFSFWTSDKVKEKYIQRTSVLLTETEQKNELAKFKL